MPGRHAILDIGQHLRKCQSQQELGVYLRQGAIGCMSEYGPAGLHLLPRKAQGPAGSWGGVSTQECEE